MPAGDTGGYSLSFSGLTVPLKNRRRRKITDKESSLFGSNQGLTGLAASSERNPQYAADLAATDVQTKADAQQEAVDRNLSSQRIDPRSGRSRVIKRQLALGTAAAKAGAANKAREGVLESNFERKLGLEGLRTSRVGMEQSERRAQEASERAEDAQRFREEQFQYQVGKEAGEAAEAERLARKAKRRERKSSLFKLSTGGTGETSGAKRKEFLEKEKQETGRIIGQRKKKNLLKSTRNYLAGLL